MTSSAYFGKKGQKKGKEKRKVNEETETHNYTVLEYSFRIQLQEQREKEGGMSGPPLQAADDECDEVRRDCDRLLESKLLGSSLWLGQRGHQHCREIGTLLAKITGQRQATRADL